MQISEGLAEFYGILLGDGCLSYTHPYGRTGPKYLIRIAGDSRNDVDFFGRIVSLIHKLFDLNVRIRKRAGFNGIEIGFSSKRVFAFLRDLGFPVGKKHQITISGIFLQNHLWLHVVRGIFDTDGCLVFSKQHKNLHYYPRVEITSSSEWLIEQLRSLLLRAKFTCSSRRTDRNCWKLEVAGKQSLEKWIRTVGSNNPKHVRKYLKWRELGYYSMVPGWRSR